MKTRWWIVAAAALAVAVSPVRAQQVDEPADQRAPMVQQVEGIHRSLEQIALKLDELLAARRVELLIQRIELKERRLAPLESRLEKAESAFRGTADEVRKLEGMESGLEETLDTEILEGRDQPDSETRRMIEELERYSKELTAELEVRRLRVRELEDQLADQREEIDAMDELLLELVR